MIPVREKLLPCGCVEGNAYVITCKVHDDHPRMSDDEQLCVLASAYRVLTGIELPVP